MSDWRFVLATTAGDHIAELSGATARTITWNLDSPATASFNIPGTMSVASQIVESATDLLVYSPSSALKFRGRMGSSDDSVSAAGHTCSLAAVDYRGFLGRRIIWPGSTATFTTVEQTSIAWQLISDSQALPGGNLGITNSSVTSGVTRSMTYAEGDVILSRIDELSAFTDGFEWEIDPSLAFQTYYPYRGNLSGLVLSFGKDIVSFQRTLDTSTFANAVRWSGATGLTAVTAAASTFDATGRWEIQVGDTNVADQPTLNAKAPWELAKDSTVTPAYQATLTPGWWTPEALWLGDAATLSLKSGRLDVFAQLRVTSVTVTVGDSGGEVVTITFGGVPLSGPPTVQQAATARIQIPTTLTTLRNLEDAARKLNRR